MRKKGTNSTIRIDGPGFGSVIVLEPVINFDQHVFRFAAVKAAMYDPIAEKYEARKPAAILGALQQLPDLNESIHDVGLSRRPYGHVFL